MRSVLFSLAISLCVPFAALAQRLPAGDPDAPSVLSDVPSVPGISARLRGLNGGITLTAVHDSSAGWYELLTPAVSYSFGGRYSLDLSVPVYLYRLSAETATAPPPGPGGPPSRQTNTTTLVGHTWQLGDTVAAGHINFANRRFSDTLTPSLTLPSGDSNSGLSTGRVTFDIDNHIQANLRRAALLLSFGGGDSSNLVNRLVTKNYTSLGPLAHFQAGVMLPLVRSSTFQTVAYEQLPLGDSKIYTTLTRPGFPDLTVVSGRSVSEDNGFISSLTVPLQNHLTLQGYYNRSLRLHLDIAAVSLTWVARPYRAAVRNPQPRLIDDLLR